MIDIPEPRRILVIKPSSLGDVVHTLPAVSALKKRFPGAEIHWLVNTEWEPILEGNPDLAATIPFPRRDWKRGWLDIGKARAWARSKLGDLEPDLTLDFQGLLRSGLLARASGAGITIGFQQAREGAALFYDHKIAVPRWKETHAVDRCLALAGALGCDTGSPEFALPEGEKVPSAPDPGTPWVLLHPFSRGKGKSLGARDVARLARALDPVPVVLVGAGFDWPEEESLPGNVTDLLGRTTLSQLIHLMRIAAWTVSVDSGPMHLAAGISDRVLSIHTWTDPLMVGPYPRTARVYRDGTLLTVGEVSPGQFPEERSKRGRFPAGADLLDDEGVARIAEFVTGRLSSSSSAG